jgi:hypothetical protein
MVNPWIKNSYIIKRSSNERSRKDVAAAGDDDDSSILVADSLAHSILY